MTLITPTLKKNGLFFDFLHRKKMKHSGIGPLAALLVIWILNLAIALSGLFLSDRPAKAQGEVRLQQGQVQTLTNHFVLKIKLSEKAAEASKIRDYARKAIGEEFELSRFSETYQRRADDVIVRAEIPILKALSVVGGPDKIVRSSSHFYRGPRLMLNQTVEQRGSRGDVFAATIDHRKRKIQYTKNRSVVKEESFEGDVIDLTSLPYYWFGRQVDVRDLTIHVTDAKKLHRDEVFVAQELSVNFLGERIRVVKFSRKKKDADSEPLEIWVRKEDGIPIRFTTSLNKKYGVQLDVYPFKKAERS